MPLALLQAGLCLPWVLVGLQPHRQLRRQCDSWQHTITVFVVVMNWAVRTAGMRMLRLVRHIVAAVLCHAVYI
jgi:hypothetical protein